MPLRFFIFFRQDGKNGQKTGKNSLLFPEKGNQKKASVFRFFLYAIGFIGNLQAYVDSQVFANGHPGAQTIVYFIWNYGISRSRYGIASAASVVLTISIMIITLLQFKISEKWVYSE